MVNEKILEFLTEGEKQGFKLEELKKALLKRGFKKAEVEEAIMKHSSAEEKKSPVSEIKRDPNEKPKPVMQVSGEKLSFFKKIKLAIINPNELFQKTESEGIVPALKYQLIISIFPFIIYSIIVTFFLQIFFSVLGSTFSSIIPIPQSTLAATGFAFAIPFIIVFVISFFITTPIITFVIAGILHLVVKMFKGQGNYAATYKSTVYSSTPTALFSFIPFVNFAVMIWSIVLTIFGISSYHKITKLKAFFSVLILTLTMFLIGFILFFITFAFTGLNYGEISQTSNSQNGFENFPTTNNPEELRFEFQDFTSCSEGIIRVYAKNLGQYQINEEDWTIHEIDSETIELSVLADLFPQDQPLNFGLIMDPREPYEEGPHTIRLGVSETNVKTTEVTC